MIGYADIAIEASKKNTLDAERRAKRSEK